MVRNWIIGAVLVLCIGTILWFEQTTISQTDIKPETEVKTIPTVTTNTAENDMSRDVVIETWFAPLRPITLGSIALQASVADTDETRQQGLSNTPYLPDGVVKLFIFESDNTWGFWMKDMLYPIDMVWLDANKVVVHIEANVTPESFPASYAPPVPARYVIETQAGFTTASRITVGSSAMWEE